MKASLMAVNFGVPIKGHSPKESSRSSILNYGLSFNNLQPKGQVPAKFALENPQTYNPISRSLSQEGNE
jgi:hypothetical protein